MSLLADSIVDEARKWVGTPFQHQGRSEFGVDCVGLLVMVGLGLGLQVEDDTVYDRTTNGEILMRCLSASCDQVDESQAGDIVVFQRARTTWHAGIVISSKPWRMIHSWGGQRNPVVREEAIDRNWAGRIHSVWRYREAS